MPHPMETTGDSAKRRPSGMDHIGQYRILRKIGAGGMGTVFVGEHILLGRQAAIKMLVPTLAVQHEVVERFFNEARATSAISDPGVVQIYDFGYHVDRTPYIVMELLAGESLSVRIDRRGALRPIPALRLARQIAGALAAAHARDIIHRDLKPDNVFLVRDSEAPGGERAKVLDFGICKIERDDEALTGSGVVLGTPAYMSPEQCQGAGRIDQRSDIYSLGCVVFHMLTGRAPFECDGAGEFIVAHMQQVAPAPSSFAELPAAIDALVGRCLAKSPADRFRSMTELQRAIGGLIPNSDATPIEIRDSASALALGTGFGSEPCDQPLGYNGNLGTAVPTHDIADQQGPDRPGARARGRSLVAIAFAVVMLALVAFENHTGDVSARPVSQPVQPIAPQPAADARPDTGALPAAYASEPPKVAPAPRDRPVVRRPTPAKPTAVFSARTRWVRPAADPIEDLYETR